MATGTDDSIASATTRALHLIEHGRRGAGQAVVKQNLQCSAKTQHMQTAGGAAAITSGLACASHRSELAGEKVERIQGWPERASVVLCLCSSTWSPSSILCRFRCPYHLRLH